MPKLASRRTRARKPEKHPCGGASPTLQKLSNSLGVGRCKRSGHPHQPTRFVRLLARFGRHARCAFDGDDDETAIAGCARRRVLRQLQALFIKSAVLRTASLPQTYPTQAPSQPLRLFSISASVPQPSRLTSPRCTR